MSAMPVQHFLNEESFLGGLLAFHADAHQVIGWQDDGVPPLNVFAVASAADEADIATHNFRDDVGYKVFFQSKGIGRDWRLFLHCHCCNFPNLRLPHEAMGKDGIVASGTRHNSETQSQDSIPWRVVSHVETVRTIECIGTCAS